MDTLVASRQELLGPINLDWTIAELLEWLGDDTHQHDDALRDPLSVIEAALTGSPWAGVPSTVALIRSIVGAVRAAPGLGSIRIGSLIPSSHGVQSAHAPHGGHGRARSARPESMNPDQPVAQGRSKRMAQRTDRSTQPA